MLFNSLEFLLFGILFFALWPVFRRKSNSKWLFITITSFIFYGWWDWRFLFLIAGSGLLDYWCGLQMEKPSRNRRLYLVLSLVGNIAGLSVFKYGVFLGQMGEDLFAVMGAQVSIVERIPDFTLILPVGISFYTFQSMSYSIDIYRKRLEPTKNILHFFSFLSMFPQLVAGPIIRARDLLGQLAADRIPNNTEVWNGLRLIVLGSFQKMVIADNLSYLVDSAYLGRTHYDGTIFWWIAVIGFGFQIYCDFCGYSLIARGLAKCMGLHFKMNFDHPYISGSLREFWTRWHISLSTWFRDYVYIPLGGSRKGVGLGILFMLFTMVVSGIWHGANYTFIMWGLMHGVWLAIERLTKWPKLVAKLPFGKYLNVTITFFIVMLSWNYFRAADLKQANEVFVKLLTYKPTDFGFVSEYFNPLFFLGIGLTIEFVAYARKKMKWAFLSHYRQNWVRESVVMALAIVGILMFHGEGKAFIYFQF